MAITFKYSSKGFKMDVKAEFNKTNDGGLDVLFDLHKHERKNRVIGYMHLGPNELADLQKYLAE